MFKNLKLNLLDEILILIICIFSIFINRSFTLDAHSLGLSMQAYSEIFPSTQDVLQPQRVLLPLIGFLLKINLQTINLVITYFFLNLLFKHILKFQSRVITFLLCASLSTTMIIQFNYNFGAYPDILCYFLLLLTFTNKERKYSPYVYFFLALLTKETAIFTALFFLGLRNISKIKLVLACSFYMPIYLFLNTGTYNLNHYLAPLQTDILHWFNQSKPYLFTGYFSSIKFLWIIIPIYIFKNFKNSLPIFFLIMGISLQFMFGGDTTRFISFIFLALVYIFENYKLNKVLFLNLLILFLNTVTAKYYIYAYGQMEILNKSKLSFLDFFEIFRRFNI